MAAEHVARIGARIRKRRDELGLTQRELADRLPGKADGNQVSKWERGEHRVSDDTLEHIGVALDVDAAYFLAPAPRAGTPDLMGGLKAGQDDRVEQLDRIEAKLDELLERITSPDEAELVPGELDDVDLPPLGPGDEDDESPDAAASG